MIELGALLDRNLEVQHQDLTQDRIMGDDHQKPVTEDVDEFGNIGVKSLSYNQSQIHSDYHSTENIADSDLEDDRIYVKKRLHRCVYVGREENSDSSRKPTASGKPEAKLIQKRRASAQRTQADHSRRREFDVKFISRAESYSEPSLNTYLRKKLKQQTGKPVREQCSFCFQTCLFFFSLSDVFSLNCGRGPPPRTTQIVRLGGVIL